MKNILTIIIACIFISWSIGAHAVWYQVELIVFENLYPQSDGEVWHKTPDLIELDDTVILKSIRNAISGVSEENNTSDEDIQLLPYTILPDENYRMNGIYRVLRLSREYRPLYHVSWQQPGLDGNQAKSVHLQTNDVANLYELTMPATLVTDPMPVNFYEPVNLSLDGTLRIRSNLYLYLDLDMVLFRQPPLQESDYIEEISVPELPSLQVPEIEPVEYVRLFETRRIKLNELHYFDHPMFGVIVQVSRYGTE